MTGGAPPYALSWSSNIDGPIGSSQTFAREDLSVADHLITVVVTDALGASTAATTEIHIPPASFDWRNVNGNNWMTSVKAQACNDCKIFAWLGVMEAKYNIQEDDPDLDLDLSEQYALECYGRAWKKLLSSGVPVEACHTYGGSAGCGGSCPATCDDGTGIELWKASGYGYVFPNPVGDKADLQHALIENGPLYVEIGVTPMSTIDRTDKDGCLIYSCGGGSVNHAVVLVGYDNVNQYWIIKNSYGAAPANPCYDGYESIDYGTCLLGHQMTGYFIETVVHP